MVTEVIRRKSKSKISMWPVCIARLKDTGYIALETSLPGARCNAAHARSLVESSGGMAEFASVMIKGSSVHPRITASQPALFMPTITLRT